MLKFFHLNLVVTILMGTLLSSCNNKKDNFDIDLSTFKIQKKVSVKKPSAESPDTSQFKKEKIENKLINYQEKSEVINSIVFGKKDPFSAGGIQQNKLTSDFQLTGFLETEINKYVFVSYQNKDGIIEEGSIGGVNTNLLPNGAKVIKIDPKNMQLIINFENENFTYDF